LQKRRHDQGPTSFPLIEAAPRLFPQHWARLAAVTGGETQALAALDRPDPGPLAVARRRALEEGGLAPDSSRAALAEEDAGALVEAILAALREAGATARVAADGIFAGSGQRQPIPAELWRDAKFELRAGSLASGAFAWRHVRLALTSAAAETLAGEVADWLRRRREENGDEPKKTLANAASERFGARLTVRAFNAAYARCYSRPRKPK